MIISSRVRPLLIVVLFAGYYAVNQPVAEAVDFCDQICSSSNYCGWGCYDETGGLGYTDCWTYTGGNCDETYPSCDWPYSSGNWPIDSREKIGTRTNWEWLAWPPPFYWPRCYDYYDVHATSLCGLGEHDFCEKQLVKLDGCDAEIGNKCDDVGLVDCYPGNDCH